MSAITEKSFGILIAFLAPGFLALWGLRCFVPEVGEWFAVSSANPATVGGFLFVTVAAIAAGLLAQSVRHLTLDKFFARFLEGEHDGTGARALYRSREFSGIVENHYRYYQFDGNTFIVLLMTYLVHNFSRNDQGYVNPAAALLDRDLIVLVTLMVLFFAAGGTWRRTQQRIKRLAAEIAAEQQAKPTDSKPIKA